MRKHYKIISSIACLLLCVCMVTFGVYAARYGLVTLSSSVSFTPTTAKLKIFGGIAGQAGFKDASVDSKQIYYACNHGTGAASGHYQTSDSGTGKKDVFDTWNFDKIYFAEYEETGTKTHPDPICFYLQITNYVEADVNYTITLSNPSDKLGYSFAYYSVDNSTLNGYTQESATSAGWWYVGATSASKPTFHNNTTKPEKTSLTATNSTNSKTVDLSSVDTTLKTIMLIVEIQVVDADDSLLGENFNFTVTATNANN